MLHPEIRVEVLSIKWQITPQEGFAKPDIGQKIDFA